MDADAPLRQLQHGRLAELDLQAVAQEFAFDALFMLAALGQLVGAAGEQEGAAERGAEARGASGGHGVESAANAVAKEGREVGGRDGLDFGLAAALVFQSALG
ncbi:hypothetical protein GCM10027514_22480 [Azotobacter armeniacus]